MRTKLLFIAVIGLSELLLDTGHWISEHLAISKAVASIAGQTIDAGDRNGLRPH